MNINWKKLMELVLLRLALTVVIGLLIAAYSTTVSWYIFGLITLLFVLCSDLPEATTNP